MRNIISLCIGILIITSCDSNRIYQDFNDMDEAFWHMDSIQSFNFEIEDTTKRYNVLATFRNSSSYPFYNLYFQYTISDSTNNVIEQELKEINFFDPKTGEPFGSGLGDLFDHTYALREEYRFKETGFYRVDLQQFMRMDTLPYVLSVGARVEFTE
ncbi:MAG: gliding motility lipoprotein GldH [Bacteroidota bacterium]